MIEVRTRNELIGRAAMLVVTALLLVGGGSLIRTGCAAHHEENAFYAEQRGSQPRRTREARIGPVLVIGGAALGIGGLWFLKLALLPHHRLDRNPPKPRPLWDNPGEHY